MRLKIIMGGIMLLLGGMVPVTTAQQWDHLQVNMFGYGGRYLSGEEVVDTGQSFFTIIFNEEMNITPNDVSSVTNHENYRLLSAGADGRFDTHNCAPQNPMANDDIRLRLADTQYNFDLQMVTILIHDAFLPLQVGRYRFIICPHIKDTFNRQLDGDYDGFGGDIYAIDFWVQTDTAPTATARFGEISLENDIVTLPPEPFGRLEVIFDEAVAYLGSPVHQNLVEQASYMPNYHLIYGRTDGLQTQVSHDYCRNPQIAASDLKIPIESLLYDERTTTATLMQYPHLHPYPDGEYILIVCSTITDLAGTDLDGNHDGLAGGDKLVRFYVGETNRTPTTAQATMPENAVTALGVEMRLTVNGLTSAVVRPDDDLVFTLVVNNTTDQAIESATVSQVFPSTISNLRNVSSSVGSVQVQGQLVTITGVSLQPQEYVLINITGNMQDNAQVITHQASLTASETTYSNRVSVLAPPSRLPATGGR